MTRVPAADPIYAAIEAHRKAYATMQAVFAVPMIGDTDKAMNEVCLPEFETLEAFAETVPTTIPGLLAMLVHAGECRRNEPEAFDYFDCPLIENLAIAAKALSRV